MGSTGRVIRMLRPTLAGLGLEADNSKQDALKLADEQGAAFMSMFTTFGSFSIAAGILLIFLIFVMLAAERRGELGIARAIGTRRTHLVQMFLYEGLAYDLVAAAVGALLGIAVAFVMVLAMAAAFNAESDISISFSVKPTSIVIAYAIGVLLTLAVVVVLGLARQSHEHRQRHPQPARAAGGRWPTCSLARWARSASCSGALLIVSGVELEGRNRRSASAFC